MTTDIDSATTTDMSSAVTDITVDVATDTGVSDSGETTYQADWTKWLGYYQQIPELAAIIDKKAFWTVGKGFSADEKTTKILKRIKGWGKDNFNSLLYNFVRTYTINGDAFAEIIRDKAGRLVNLKPLNPGQIKIVADKFGMVIRYEHGSRTKRNSFVVFKPEEILHFAWNRLADEIHGISTIDKLQDIINYRKEAMDDLRVVFHRYVKPLLISHVDTDDTTEIAAYKTNLDNAVKNMENIIIPKDTVEKIERISVPQFSTLDPLPWIKLLQKHFVISEGVPVDHGEDTEASSKIAYLEFQQMVEWNQLFLERELESQVGIKIDLEFPASIEPSLLGDEKKDTPINEERKSEVSP